MLNNTKVKIIIKIKCIYLKHDKNMIKTMI